MHPVLLWAPLAGLHYFTIIIQVYALHNSFIYFFIFLKCDVGIWYESRTFLYMVGIQNAFISVRKKVKCCRRNISRAAVYYTIILQTDVFFFYTA